MHRTVLERIAAGDSNALDECMDHYGALIWSLARSHLKQHADAEDAVQEIFIEIWRSAGRFDPAIASEPAFITMISRRRLIDRQRKQSRAVATHSMVDQPAALSRSQSDHVDLKEDVERARLLMGGLKPHERNVLELALLDGLTQSEIAEASKLPLGTVKTHTRRGLIRLRQMFDPEVDATFPQATQ